MDHLSQFISAFEHVAEFSSDIDPGDDARAVKVVLRHRGLDSRPLFFAKQCKNWVIDRSEKGGGVHEPGLMKTLLVLSKMPSMEDATFFDIGALHGYVSLMAAEILKPKAVYAFEMNPMATRIATRNVQLNPRLGTPVEVVNAGVAAKTLKAAPCYFKGFQLIVEPDAADVAKIDTDMFRPAEIDILTLDDFSTQTGVVPRIVKIDVEGSQMSILKGAQRILDEHAPILLIETDTARACNSEGVSMTEMSRMLMDDFGYALALMDHRSRFTVPRRIGRSDLAQRLPNLELNRLLIAMRD